MLLERFLVRDGIKKELPPLLLVLAAAVVAAALRHVFAPLLVQLGELLEFFLEIVVLLAVIVRRRFWRLFFQHRVGLQFLLDDVAKLQHRGLQDDQALLQLRREHLLHRQVLGLLHSGARHMVRKMNKSSLVGKPKSGFSQILECFLLQMDAITKIQP